MNPFTPFPTLIIITGEATSGKTTIGRQLAKALALPFINRDDIKEIIFDQLGWKDRNWSHKVGLVGYELLYYFAGQLLQSGKSCIIETTFKPQPERTHELTDLITLHQTKVIQVYCYAKPEILIERFIQRSQSSERHPGHDDQQNIAEFEKVVREGLYQPLALEGELIEVDTSDWSKVNVDQLIQQINNLL